MLKYCNAFHRHAQNVIDDYLREVSEKALKGAQKVLDAGGVKHNMAIKRGNIAGEILAMATKEKYNPIVIGSKGEELC